MRELKGISEFTPVVDLASRQKQSAERAFRWIVMGAGIAFLAMSVTHVSDLMGRTNFWDMTARNRDFNILGTVLYAVLGLIALAAAMFHGGKKASR